MKLTFHATEEAVDGHGVAPELSGQDLRSSRGSKSLSCCCRLQSCSIELSGSSGQCHMNLEREVGSRPATRKAFPLQNGDKYALSLSLGGE